MALMSTTCCPMCGKWSEPGARHCLSCGEELKSANAGALEDSPRELRKWILQRTAWCVALIFVVAFGFTQPSFYRAIPFLLPAVSLAGTAAVIFGTVLAIRATLRRQQQQASGSVAERLAATGRVTELCL